MHPIVANSPSPRLVCIITVAEIVCQGAAMGDVGGFGSWAVLPLAP